VPQARLECWWSCSGGVTVKILMLFVTVLALVRPVAAHAQSADVLSDDQRTAITLAQAEAEQKTAPIAVRLGWVVKQIYDNNLSDTPDAALTARLDDEMKELVWQLLLIKGESMWAAVRVLTPEQRATIRGQVAKAAASSDVPDLMDVIARTFKLTDKKE